MRKVIGIAENKPTGIITFFHDDHVEAKPATDKEPAVEAKPSFDVFDIRKVSGGDLFDPDSIVGRLALHGASQKIGDSVAGVVKDAKELNVDAVQLAKDYIRETIAQLYAGTWRVNAGGGPRVNELAVAISRATGMPLEGDEGTIALVAAMDEATTKAWRKKPKVALELTKIAAEKLAKKLAEQEKAAAAEA